MNNGSFTVRPALCALAVAGVAVPALTRAQEYDLEQSDRSGWYFRADAVARFNAKATVTGSVPTPGPGVYNDGYVLPDASGAASGKTWNWGYNSANQIVGNQLVLNRLDNVPTVGMHDLSMNPLVGGEIIGGYQLQGFQLWNKTVHLGFEVGYGYSGFSKGMGFSASGTATRTTDSYDLGGIVPPQAPYGGTAAGPGPIIGLGAAGHNVISSAASTAFQGSLDTSFHSVRIGPSFELDLTKRLGVTLGLGYSSVFADSDFSYTEAVTFANPAIPAIPQSTASIHNGTWCQGAYAELLLNYRITQRIGALVGADIQYHTKSAFGDAGHQVNIDLGTTFGTKAGVMFRF